MYYVYSSVKVFLAGERNGKSIVCAGERALHTDREK